MGREKLDENPFLALNLTLEKKYQTGEARSEGYMQWECVQSLARDFCLGCQVETEFVIFYFPPS